MIEVTPTKEKNDKNLASIKNEFVVKAGYDLTRNESKLLMYLIATIDSKNAKDFELRTVKVKELEKVFTNDDKKWGSFYKRLDRLCRSVMGKPISIPKGFKIEEGEEVRKVQMNEYFSWFKRIRPIYDGDGEIAIEFYFHDDVKPFLLSIQNKFVQIDTRRYFQFSGKYTLLLYPAFKSARDLDKSRYPKSKVTFLTYGIDELRAKLGLEGKYSMMNALKRRVIDPMVEEIKEKSVSIVIDYEYIKGRKGKVTAIEFSIRDVIEADIATKVDDLLPSLFPNFVPTQEDIDKLPHAKRKAYQELVEFGVIEGIAYKEILPRIKGEIVEGFEDYFVELSLIHFRKKTKAKTREKKIASYVIWWKNGSFDSLKEGDWGKIAEATYEKAKKLKESNPEAYDNRMQAKDMTYTEFVEWHRTKGNEESVEA